MTYPRVLLQKPKLVLTAWLLLLASMVVFVALWPQISINPTLKTMIMPADPDLAMDGESKQVFGDDEILIIAVAHPDTIINIETLTKIDRITRKVEEIEGVRDVLSMTRADNIRDRDGTLDTDDLIEELPENAEDLQRIVEEVDANPTYVNTIISEDKKVAAITVEMSLDYSSTEERARITQAVLAITEAEAKSGAEKIHVTGFPVSSYFGGIYMITDMGIFTGVASFLLIVILWIIFRNKQGIVFTLLVGALGVATVYGIMSLSDTAVTMPLSSLIVFIMALGMEYSIYVAYAYITQVRKERAASGPPRDRVEILASALDTVTGPVLLSSLTTMTGFLSMLSNPVFSLVLMGFYLAIGTVVVGLASLTLVPALIALWPFEVKERKGSKRRFIDRMASKLGSHSANNPIKAFLVMTTILILAVIGWLNMSMDTDAMNYFKRHDKIRIDEELVRARMGGTTYLQAVIASGERDTFKEPENLRKLAELQEFAESLPNVTKALSQADNVRLLHRALRGENDAYTVPDRKAAIEQLLLLHNEPDDFRLVVDMEYQWANVMIRMNTMSSSRMRVVERDLEAKMRELFPDMKVNLVGTTLLAHRAFDKIASSMITGLLIACGAIWLIMCFAFRSIKLGSLAIIPNVLPIAIIYSVLGWIGKPLDPPTAVTGALVLGIAVDDTVHFFKTWQRWCLAGAESSRRAVISTLDEIGRPMVMSSIVLAFGFGVLILSRYEVLLWVGAMLCIASVVGIVCDLVLTPAILALTGKGTATTGKSKSDEAAGAAASV